MELQREQQVRHVVRSSKAILDYSSTYSTSSSFFFSILVQYLIPSSLPYPFFTVLIESPYYHLLIKLFIHVHPPSHMLRSKHWPVMGVAMLVPLIWCTAHVGPPFKSSFPLYAAPRARAFKVWEGSPDQADCTKSPGATTSGLIRPSLVGPIELKQARRLDW